MQDRQTQVRGGPARVVGRLRETDGMLLLLLQTRGPPDGKASGPGSTVLQSHDLVKKVLLLPRPPRSSLSAL